MPIPSWMYQDPQKVVEYKQNGTMMKDAKVRQWAKRLSRIHDRLGRHEFLMKVPEQYRDAVEQLARNRT